MSQTNISTLAYFSAPPARRTRFVAWIISVTALVTGTLIWLYALRGHRIVDHNLVLIGGWIALGAVTVAIAVLLKTTPPDAIRLPRRTSKWLVVGGAALLQLAAVLLLAPALSEDGARYRLDGLMWLEGVSPYATTPQQFLKETTRADSIDAMVTFSRMHTVYPPVAQAAFVAARWIEESWSPVDLGPAESTWSWRRDISLYPATSRAFVLRALFALTTVGTAAVLISILTSIQRSPWWAVLFAWNPLVVIETGGMGHVDILGVLFVLLMVRALQLNRPVVAAAMLALAAGVKPPAVLLTPFLLRDARTILPDARQQVRLALMFILFLALIYSPLLIDRGYEGWLRTLQIYARSWEANGSVYDLIKWTADPADGVAVQRAKDAARLLGGFAVVIAFGVAWLGRCDLPHAGYWIYLIALLTAAVVYPWYLLWVLAFVPLLRGWQGITGLVWSATIGISYLLWRTIDWVLPPWALLVEYVPVYAMMIVELALAWKRPSPQPSPSVLGEGV